MTERAPELIIFDLDGTLVDSRRDLAAALNHARSHFGLPPLEVERVARLVGDGVRVLLERGFATVDPNVVEAALRLFLPWYEEHCLDQTTLYPGVREGLAELADRKLAVVTNKPERFSRKILSGLDVAGCFAHVIGGDSGPARKPDPAGIRAVLERTGVSAERALVVGDSLHDLRAARAAGVRAAAVTYGFGDEAELRAAQPDFVFARFGELPARLERDDHGR